MKMIRLTPTDRRDQPILVNADTIAVVMPHDCGGSLIRLTADCAPIIVTETPKTIEIRLEPTR